MPLTLGSQLGSHEIIALLGKGGMGEVYRARDLKLKREVAIKILPEEFARDADRVGRFQREAEVLASLNHPNIAAIHDLEETNGTRYLVLELVEGETLAERIARGPIPVEEALPAALQICEALEAAHERGIIHRDLKPANVKLTPDGIVKVLDFGLAKAMESSPASATLSNSPTMLSATMGGMILGTAAYMSPEQARGREADQRSDVFGFGCILYEMLTGSQPFQGEDVSDVLAAVMRVEPDFTRLPQDTNPKLYELIRRCLMKSRRNRWHAIGDVRVELESIIAEPRAAKAVYTVGTSPSAIRFGPTLVSVLLTAVATVAAMWILRPAQQPHRIARFSITIPSDQDLASRRTGRQIVAITRDGANVVFVANGQLYLKSLSEAEGKPISGTNQGPVNPILAPDGQWIAFYSFPEQKLKKILWRRICHVD